MDIETTDGEQGDLDAFGYKNEKNAAKVLKTNNDGLVVANLNKTKGKGQSVMSTDKGAVAVDMD